MPFIYCPVCESAASDQAPYCPKCGHPLAAAAAPRQLTGGAATEGDPSTAEPQSARRARSTSTPPTQARSDVELIQEALRRQQQRPQVVVRPAPLVQTIERTGKKWKAIMLTGAMLFIFGIGTCMVGVKGGPRGSVAFLADYGFFVSLIGMLVFLAGRIGGWWYHG